MKSMGNRVELKRARSRLLWSTGNRVELKLRPLYGVAGEQGRVKTNVLQAGNVESKGNTVELKRAISSVSLIDGKQGRVKT